MEEFDYEKLLSLVDLKKGDFIDVASDLITLAFYCKKQKVLFDTEHLLDCMQTILSEEGTMMIRTFNWDFCRNVGFDRNRTPSRVGNLGNIARKRTDFLRTSHPPLFLDGLGKVCRGAM
jgi:aminoglycoside 3-N-acetyltransferase